MIIPYKNKSTDEEYLDQKIEANLANDAIVGQVSAITSELLVHVADFSEVNKISFENKGDAFI